jgi:hypothetical protein
MNFMLYIRLLTAYLTDNQKTTVRSGNSLSILCILLFLLIIKQKQYLVI